MAERTRRHQEWLDYFKTLAARYQDNPLYPNAGSVTWQTMDAIDDAPDVDAFKSKMWSSTLLLENVVALLRDQETARAAAWAEVEDPVRGHGAATLLTQLDDASNVIALREIVAATRHETARAVAIDTYVDCIGDDFAALEDIEVWETAEVPERWRAELDARLAAADAEGRRRWTEELAPAARAVWDGWAVDDREVWATRHRRRLPYPDAVVERRVTRHRRYRGAE